MIYYFSGTGNSQWVAQELARLTDDQSTDIVSIMQNTKHDTDVRSDDADRIGLVFPIYAWGAPKIIDEFIARLSFSRNAYVYAICTCGDDAGHALKRLRKRFHWKAAWSVIMPNNYIPMYDVDPSEQAAAKLHAARKRLSGISQHILAGDSLADVHEGTFSGVKTALINPVFRTFAASTKPFLADDTCTGCGLCERICPRKAIVLTNSKPVWTKKHCLQCMACINRCPQRAIQYGENTRVRGRYYFGQ